MSGMQPTHTRRNGQMLTKVFIFTLVVMLIFSSCSAYFWVGEGRGDWTMDVYGGYAIARINSYSKCLVYKENLSDTFGSYVIENYFVTAYQLRQPYILIEGFFTADTFASEGEMKHHIMNYHVVDADNHEIYGPFETYEDFEAFCESIDLETSDEWEILPN